MLAIRRNRESVCIAAAILTIASTLLLTPPASGATEQGGRRTLDECIEQVRRYNEESAQVQDVRPDPEPGNYGPPSASDRRSAIAAERLEGLAAQGRSASQYVGRPISVEGEYTGLDVPAEGIIAEVHELGINGSVPAAATVCNPGDGTLTVEVEASHTVEWSAPHPADESPADESEWQAVTACTQTGNSYTPSEVQAGNIAWYYNNEEGQTHITDTEFRDLTKSGFDGMLTGRNSCNFSDPISLTATLVGATTAGTGGTKDNRNTMGWGYVSTTAAARTYQWSDGKNMTEFDIRYTINEVDKRLAETITSSCTHSLHFGSVALHEVMHGYGMEHVSGTLQTMYPTVGQCETHMYTMAKGDWDGVANVYN